MIKLIQKILAGLFWVMASYTVSLCQELPLEYFGIEEGLASSRIDYLRILEDGRLAICCEGTYSIYDGYDFQHLPGWSWFWFGALNEKDLWLVDSKSSLIKLENLTPFNHPASQRIKEEKEGKYPVSMSFNKEGAAYITYGRAPSILKAYPNGNVEKIALDQDYPVQSVFFETRYTNEPIFGWTASRPDPVKLFVDGKLILQQNSKVVEKADVVQGPNGLILSYNEYIFFLEPDTLIIRKSQGYINRLFVDSREQLWLATRSGVEVWDLENKQFVASTVKGQFATAICEDWEKHVWIGTTVGLYRVKATDIAHYEMAGSTDLTMETGPYIFNENNSPLIVSYKSAFSIDGSAIVPNEQLSSLLVRGLTQGKNYYWDLTSQGEINRKNKEGETDMAVNVKTPLEGYSTLERETDSTFWAMCNNDLLLLDENHNILVSEKDEFEGVLPQDVRFVHGTGTGALYYTVGQVLYKYLKGETEMVMHALGNRKMLDVWRTAERKGNTYYGTVNDGIWIETRDSVYNLTMKDGVVSNRIQDLVFQNDSVFWIATNKGLQKVEYGFNKKNLNVKFQTIDKADGLKTSDLTAITPIGNKLWLSNTLGVSCIDITTLAARHQTLIPGPRLQWADVNGTQKTDRKNFGTGLILSPEQDEITLCFKAVSFRDSRRKQYGYRLLGFDSSWKDTRDTTVIYRFLPPGAYTFEVRSIDRGRFSDETDRLDIFIDKAFWQRWYFITFMVILSQVVVISLIWRYTQARRKRLKLERDKFESEIKALKAQFNPHFVFNALGAVQETMMAGDSMSAVANISKLATLMRKMLHSSRKKRSSLHEVEEILILYLDLEILRQPGRFKYVINFDEESSLSKDLINLPISIVQPFVENAVIHGASQSKDAGFLRVGFEIKGPYLRCRIVDNGPGMNHNIPDQRPDEHLSLGISLVEEQIRLLNLELSEKIVLQVGPPSSDNVGTEVLIDVPLDF